MNNLPSIFIANPKSHFITPGAIDFVPAWVILYIAIFTYTLFNSKKFTLSTFLAFSIGAVLPAIDDLLAFVIGPPFTHHSLFHSIILGPTVTYLFFKIISNHKHAKMAFLGDLTHIFFNFYFDSLALLFPLTYQEFGLSDLAYLNTYWIKATHYPVIFLLFFISIVKYFHQFKNKK